MLYLGRLMVWFIELHKHGLECEHCGSVNYSHTWVFSGKIWSILSASHLCPCAHPSRSSYRRSTSQWVDYRLHSQMLLGTLIRWTSHFKHIAFATSIAVSYGNCSESDHKTTLKTVENTMGWCTSASAMGHRPQSLPQSSHHNSSWPHPSHLSTSAEEQLPSTSPQW